MARININTGAEADDGTGDSLRDAFTSVNTMTTEIYADDFVTTARIADDAVTSALIADNAITNALMADDAIDHAELAPRYTTTATAVTTSGATTIDWSTAASFPITMGGAHTLNFSNFKKGQVVDLIISGAYAVTLGTTTGTPVFNKVGNQSYDTTTTNIIQVMCTDDDSTPNFFFAIGTYAVAQPQ